MLPLHTAGPLAVTLILVPGLVTWWLSRRLVAFKNDAALAERLQSTLTRALTVNFLSVIGLVVVAPGSWGLPLAVLTAVGSFAGWFPARRVLFDERWGFGAYLSHSLRFLGGYFGFWGLAAVAPTIVHGAAPYGPVAAAILGLVVLGWALFFDRVLLTLLRSRPLSPSAELAARLDAVLASAKVPRPLLFVAGPKNAVWAQAFALPRWPSPSVVLVSHTLLHDFPPDEFAAVFAHEVAHLEQYKPSRLLKASVFSLGFGAVGVLGVPAATWLGGPETGGSAALALTLGLFAAWFFHQASHQSDESASDRRAAELCGDPEALVRALGRLHALAGVPRRMDPEVEVSASHPSLARRVAAIRSAKPVEASAASSPAVLATARPGAFVILEAERVSWLDGVAPGTDATDPAQLRAAAREVVAEPYGELTELLLKARGTAIELHARTRSGARRVSELAAGSVATAQKALELAEGRLAPSSPLPQFAGTFAAVLGLLASYLAGATSLALPGLCALFRPRARTLVAVAVALSGAIVFQALGVSESRFRGLSLLLGALSIAACLWCAFRDRRAGTHAGVLDWLAAGALLLAPLAAVGAASLQLAFEPSLYQLHKLARSFPSASLHALALAGAILVGTRRRGWSVAPLLVGAAWLVVATPGFRARLADEPLLEKSGSPPSAMREVEAQVVASVRLGEATTGLKLSPNATRFALERWDRDVPSVEVRGWDASSPALEFEASSAQFVTEDELVALDERRTGLRRLRVPPAESGPPWTITLPRAVWGVEIDPGRRAWSSFAQDHRRIQKWTGTVGEAGWAEAELSGGAFEGNMVWPRATRTGAYFVDRRYDWRLNALSAGLLGAGIHSLWAADARGPRLLGSSGARMGCEASPGTDAVVCAVGDDSGTQVWAFDPATGARRALASFEGGQAHVAISPDGAFAVWSSEQACGRASFAISIGGELLRIRLRREECAHLDSLVLQPGAAGLICRQHPGHSSAEEQVRSAVLVRLPREPAGR